ncbi:hypothetical protein LMG28727_07312 [Paraburkholderia kirstenboschensis]|nr:sigma 54-interacting transcriptional regulator [Paraburkholderia kirstenboschensis]CAD6561013.1 hypothetical protein LMG28727_07312 [Paraburkholderia kirstenboschensis]
MILGSGCDAQVFAQVHQLAPACTTLLLRDESGTGNEVIAHAIHELSPRSSDSLVRRMRSRSCEICRNIDMTQQN